MENRKILFACVPVDGHSNPLANPAKHLIECVYDVAGYSASYYKPKLEKLGIPFFKFTKAMDILPLVGVFTYQRCVSLVGHKINQKHKRNSQRNRNVYLTKLN